MKAMLFDRYGDPGVLRLAEVAEPVRAAGETLIRVRAVGVNPADGKWRSGMLDGVAALSFPHVGGYDVAGEVVAGDGWHPGDRVIAMVDHFRAGAYAELTVASADRIASLPETLDFATGAALPTPGLTGVQLIERGLAVRAGERVLVTGAMGAVGRFAVHAARGRGAIVVGAVRRSTLRAAATLGLDETIALDTDQYTGPPFDCIADTVGGEVVAPLCRRVAASGRIMTVATAPIPTEGIPVAIPFFAVQPDAALLARIAADVAAGKVAVPIADRLPLARAAEAQRRVEAGGAGGKIILEP